MTTFYLYLVPVDGCDSCPLCAEGAFCQHPNRPAGEYEIWAASGEDYDHDGNWHPPWCPLRREPILVQLRGKP